MTYTYGAVDESPDPRDAVRWQERLNEWREIRAYKQAPSGGPVCAPGNHGSAGTTLA